MVVVVLKALKKLYGAAGLPQGNPKPICDEDADSVARTIRTVLDAPGPGMIARFGSTELLCLANYLSVKSGRRQWLEYIRGRIEPWWWHEGIIEQMQRWSGFFPPDRALVERFCEEMLEDIPLVDVLGSWVPHERLVEDRMTHAKKVHLELLNPYFSREPWTASLRGKRVVVIHPFAETIEAQYKRRELLFTDDLLPSFELRTIKAVQSLGGEPTGFADWFEALASMRDQMDRIDYDIALIGCGAYGFPLAAHAKRSGRKGFHLGGSLQLLFGIRGKRWENPDYNPKYNFARLMNEHWVKPAEAEKPKTADKVEGACYW